MKNERAKKIRNVFYVYAAMTLATAVMAFGIHCFKYPNHFVLGGVTGLSVLVADLVPWMTPATFVSIANIVLLIVGFIFLGKSFSTKTVYCSLLLSALLELLEFVMPITQPLTDQKFLELFFTVVLSSIGSAVIFNLGGSTGGSDIVGMIIRKFFRIEIGKAVMISDILIVAASFFLFDIETGMFSMFGLIIATLIIDTSIENLNMSKYFIITTTKPEAVSAFIIKTLDRGATSWEAVGRYTGEEKTVLLVAMNRFQARRMRNEIKKIDPESFVLISNTSDIIGNGFRPSV